MGFPTFDYGVPAGAYWLWEDLENPIVDGVTGWHIASVSFFIAWDLPGRDGGNEAWEFDRVLSFTLDGDEIRLSTLVDRDLLPRWHVCYFCIEDNASGSRSRTDSLNEVELTHDEVPRVLELVWPRIFDGFKESLIGRDAPPHQGGFTMVEAAGFEFDSPCVISVQAAQQHRWGVEPFYDSSSILVVS